MKKFLGIICLIYSGIIAYVWIFNEIKNFLAPTMQIYLKVSLFPLVVIGLVLYFEEHIHYKFKVTDIILLLPIIMFVFAGNGRLSASFATNRMNFSNKVSSKKVDEYSSDDIKIDIKNTIVLFGNYKKSFVFSLILLIFICIFIVSMVIEL